MLYLVGSLLLWVGAISEESGSDALIILGMLLPCLPLPLLLVHQSGPRRSHVGLFILNGLFNLLALRGVGFACFAVGLGMGHGNPSLGDQLLFGSLCVDVVLRALLVLGMLGRRLPWARG